MYSLSVPLSICTLHRISTNIRTGTPPPSWTVTATAKPSWVFTVLLHRSTALGVFTTLTWQHRAGLEFTLDWWKIVLRLSPPPSVFLHDSFLWLTSSIHCYFYVTDFYQPFEDIIQNSTHELLLRAQICSEDSQQLELLYSKVTCKAFWISATASLA